MYVRDARYEEADKSDKPKKLSSSYLDIMAYQIW